MKKIVSVLLAVILAFSALAVSVAAAGGDYQTYYMEFVEKDSNVTIVPADGYDQYVLPGDDFKFYVEVADGYSDTFVIVEVDTVVIEPDVHGVYTISDVDADKQISAYLSLEEEQSNLFASLIILVHEIMEWFQNIFKSLLAFAG